MIRCRSRFCIQLLAINLFVIFLTFIYVTRDPEPITTQRKSHNSHVVSKIVDELEMIPGHLLCVIVPFRDRFEELQVFAPYMDKFLNAQGVKHIFLIMNQTDQFRFNRASLINVGWYEASENNCSYIVMHDVDLLPMNKEINYSFPGEGVVRHISSPEYHPKYKYPKFIGGILMLTINDYKKIDGMSNKYWGWGMEDDELYLRIRERTDLNLTRVAGLSTNRTNSFHHIHPKTRKRDFAVVTSNQRAMKRTRDRLSGLHNVDYVISSREAIMLRHTKVHMINVSLRCDRKWTPYCIDSAQPK